MEIEISKNDRLTVEIFKQKANGGKSFTGIRFRVGKRKPKTLFHFHHSKALMIIEALQQCIADVDDSQGGFFESKQWQRLRYLTLQRDRACLLCGSTKNLHCDHIKPRSKYPELEFDPDNLQTLCGQCNLAKSNRDEIDYSATKL